MYPESARFESHSDTLLSRLTPCLRLLYSLQKKCQYNTTARLGVYRLSKHLGVS